VENEEVAAVRKDTQKELTAQSLSFDPWWHDAVACSVLLRDGEVGRWERAGASPCGEGMQRHASDAIPFPDPRVRTARSWTRIMYSVYNAVDGVVGCGEEWSG
jgi:hypothetical protein